MRFGTFLEHPLNGMLKYLGKRNGQYLYQHILSKVSEERRLITAICPQTFVTEYGWTIQPKKNINKEEWLKGYAQGIKTNRLSPTTPLSSEERKVFQKALMELKTSVGIGYFTARLSKDAQVKEREL